MLCLNKSDPIPGPVSHAVWYEAVLAVLGAWDANDGGVAVICPEWPSPLFPSVSSCPLLSIAKLCRLRFVTIFDYSAWLASALVRASAWLVDIPIGRLGLVSWAAMRLCLVMIARMPGQLSCCIPDLRAVSVLAPFGLALHS